MAETPKKKPPIKKVKIKTDQSKIKAEHSAQHRSSSPFIILLYLLFIIFSGMVIAGIYIMIAQPLSPEKTTFELSIASIAKVKMKDAIPGVIMAVLGGLGLYIILIKWEKIVASIIKITTEIIDHFFMWWK